jgi:hypothetical protein
MQEEESQLKLRLNLGAVFDSGLKIGLASERPSTPIPIPRVPSLSFSLMVDPTFRDRGDVI